MISTRLFKTLLIVGFSLFFSNGFASDTAKEKRWADQVADSIMVGDVEWLSVGKNKIFSIYTENTTEKALGGAIVLHGSGVHPNWDQVVRPLRSQLPDHGWSTLSLQLPVLSNEAEYKDYIPLFKEVAPRINAGVKFLKSKGIKNIVIVAHSLGSGMAGYYMGNNPDSSIRAFVAVGVSGVMYKEDTGVSYLNALKKIKVPVLDIFGSNDLPQVLKGEKAKADTARKAGNKNYTQIKITGANHFFDNKDDELVKRVRGWLLKNAAGSEIKIK
ncbi:MAG: alpha/beta hydrolase family protein [Gammaproteobacteria bacterium]|nr:alpha/beta hydrolase family protein [Gammaproteobacteria bacterium]